MIYIEKQEATVNKSEKINLIIVASFLFVKMDMSYSAFIL